MFESDDFDQVLSQFEFPEEINNSKQVDSSSDKFKKPNDNTRKPEDKIKKDHSIDLLRKTSPQLNHEGDKDEENVYVKTNAKDTSPKQIKRKIIHSYFDHKSKRKFPGPAGLLNGNLEERKDENICQMELLSQDVDFTQNNMHGDIFQSPLWVRLLDDLKCWKLDDIDSIKMIKQQALNGSSRRRKAHTITAFVEAVDRSAIDPLIMMRDTTGNIKGTLHRDVWSTFSHYIAAEYCALILWKPTILTTGGAFKKHYLNITLSNILAIYSSTVLKDEPDVRPLPEGYNIVYDEDFTVIKTETLPSIGLSDSITNGHNNETEHLFEELDSIFSDEIF